MFSEIEILTVPQGGKSKSKRKIGKREEERERVSRQNRETYMEETKEKGKMSISNLID